MKMIVTGGEGFIGKALTAALKKRGVEVAVILSKACPGILCAEGTSLQIVSQSCMSDA